MNPHDHHDDDEPKTRIPGETRPSRRAFVGAGLAAGAALLAGCSGGSADDGPPPSPASLAGGKQCDGCGMVVGEHPGPNGQIFYREHSPQTHENPAWFDSLQGCLFPYYFEHDRRGWTAEAVYVTDYSVVEYAVREVEGRHYVDGATSPDSFARAGDVVFVVDSGVHGAMGPDFVPFSASADADSFVREHGGRTVAFADVTPATVGR